MEVIFRQTPKLDTGHHFGSRLVFAQDGRLFVTAGDRGQMERAQRLDEGQGKIFRIGTMGVCSSGDLLRTIQTLELILLKEGNIHSCGVGVEAMSRVLDS